MNRLTDARHRLSQWTAAWMLRFYRRPMLFLLVLVAFPLAILASAAYRVNVELVRAQSMRNLQVTARLAAEIVDRELNQMLGLEEWVVRDPSLVAELERDDAAALTPRLHALTDHLLTVRALIAHADGHVAASVPVAAQRITVHDEPWFEKVWAFRSHRAVSPVYLHDGRKVVALVAPVRRGEDLAGFIQTEYDIEGVREWVQTVRVDPDGIVYIVDHEDQLVVHPYQVLPGAPKRVSAWPPVARLVGPEGEQLSYDDARTGRRWLAAVSPVGRHGWRVVATQPERAALCSVHRIFGWLGGLVAGLLGLIALVCWRWVRLHDFTLDLMRQNAKLLRQLQQHRLGRRRPDASGGGPH